MSSTAKVIFLEKTILTKAARIKKITDTMIVALKIVDRMYKKSSTSLSMPAIAMTSP